MPARPVNQVAMDEVAIDDPVVEKALERRYRARLEMDPLRLAYREADDLAKDAIKRLELPDGGVVRVGRFRITRTFVAGRDVSFSTAARSQVRIGLTDES